MKLINPAPYDFMRYRQINIDDSLVSPQKQRRRLNILKKWSESFKGYYPDYVYKDAYWHFKIPILSTIVRENSPPFEVRQECIQYLINATIHIINAKKSLKIKTPSKIMCLISLPDMHSSEVTVFVSKQYYDDYFLRNEDYQKWELITDKNRSLLKEYNINIPGDVSLEEKGYIETISDEDENYQGEMWAIGQLGSWGT